MIVVAVGNAFVVTVADEVRTTDVDFLLFVAVAAGLLRAVDVDEDERRLLGLFRVLDDVDSAERVVLYFFLLYNFLRFKLLSSLPNTSDDELLDLKLDFVFK